MRAHGWEVALAGDGLEALSTLERQSFDVLITDNAMHGMTGLELAEHCRAAYPRMRIVISSGIPLEETLPNGVIFLAKPFDQSTLLGTIGSLLPKAATG